MANNANHILTANLIEESIMKIAFEIENDPPGPLHVQVLEEEKK